MNNLFETGPIRPPSEANSLLIRVTRNCPWNKCTFCNVYKGQKFSKRNIEDIKKDIDTIQLMVAEILEVSKKMGNNGEINRDVIMNAANANIPMQEDFYRIGAWLFSGAKTVFLQDANSLIIKTEDTVEILQYLSKKFPSIERITTYARSKTVSKKTLDELKSIHNAGLTRIHIGMESGSNRVLDLVQKGVMADEHISAGQKAIEAGFDLSEYYMPGLGGKDLSNDNAIESAKTLNAINPTFIRIRSTIPVPGTPLYKLMTENKWTPLTEEEKIKEIRLFLENLEGINSYFISDHMMNLLEDLGGALPDGKGDMLKLLDDFLAMKQEDKENFIIGRRLNYFRYLSDYKKDPKIEKIRKQALSKFPTIDHAILELLKNHI